jgi:hypothetical protein
MNLNLEKINTYLELLLKGELTQKGINNLYKEATSEYRPVIESLPGFAPLVSKDLAKVVVTALKVYNKTEQDKEVMAERNILKKNQAKRRQEILKIYVDAGFTEDQAFDLLKIDITHAKAVFANLGNNKK